MLNRSSANIGRGLRQSPPSLQASSLPSRPSLFQQARDWTAFIVSLTSLLTATFALRNTLTGPIPVLAELPDTTVTILRSDQFLVGSSKSPSVVLREETGQQADFPLLIVPLTISNRAAPPNGISVRSIEGALSVLQAGRTIFRSEYVWYRLTTSSAEPDPETKADRLVVETAAPVAPFDVPGGSTWSREVLLIPRESWAAQDWKMFEDNVTRHCSQECQSGLSIRVRFDNGMSLTAQCSFSIDRHVMAHVRGLERRFFTSPTCRAGGKPQ